MKISLSCSFLSLAMISFVSLALPCHAETPAAKEIPAAKTAAPPAAAGTTAQPATSAVPNVVPAAAPVAGQPPAAVDPAVVDPTAGVPIAIPVVEDDPLKDIVIHKRPEDFASAQLLALQNRDERSVMLQKSIACVQQSATMEDLAACQADERKELDKIRLSYCDTMVSFLNGNQNMPGRIKRNNKAAATPAAAGDAAADAQPARQQRGTECDRALAAVTGKPVPRRDAEPAVQ